MPKNKKTLKAKRAVHKTASHRIVPTTADQEPLAVASVALQNDTPQLNVAKTGKNRRQRILGYLRHHRQLSAITLALAVAMLTILAVPHSRTWLVGLVVKKDLSLLLRDAKTGEPVSEADISVGTQRFMADDTGLVHLRGLRVGRHTITITKLFYEPYKASIVVHSLRANRQQTLQLEAAGRLASVKVQNRLNGLPMQGVSIRSALGGYGKTNQNGEARLLMPYGVEQSEATINGPSILTSSVLLRAVQDDITNTFYAIPAGKVHFITYSGGALKVIASNVDGSSQEVVFTGKGGEDAAASKLFTDTDQKNTMLYSKQQTGESFLYIVTSNKEVIEIPESSQWLEPVGWLRGNFFYKATDQTLQDWQPGKYKLKRYSIEQKASFDVDQTRAEGKSMADYAGEKIGNAFVVGGSVVYVKYWASSYHYGSRYIGKIMSLNKVSANDHSVAVVYAWQAGYYSFIKSKKVTGEELALFIQLDGVQNSFWRYINGVVSEMPGMSQETFYSTSYPDFLSSPDGNSAVWVANERNQSVLYIGDTYGKNKKALISQKDLRVFGWHGNDYVLYTNAQNELWAIGRSGMKHTALPLKVTSL